MTCWFFPFLKHYMHYMRIGGILYRPGCTHSPKHTSEKSYALPFDLKDECFLNLFGQGDFREKQISIHSLNLLICSAEWAQTRRTVGFQRARLAAITYGCRTESDVIAVANPIKHETDSMLKIKNHHVSLEKPSEERAIWWWCRTPMK